MRIIWTKYSRVLSCEKRRANTYFRLTPINVSRERFILPAEVSVHNCRKYFWYNVSFFCQNRKLDLVCIVVQQRSSYEHVLQSWQRHQSPRLTLPFSWYYTARQLWRSVLQSIPSMRVCLWCLLVCLWVCYHDNLKLCASILIKLGM